MAIGVIGYGSIGKRHVDNLIRLGHDNIVLLRSRLTGNPNCFSEVLTLDELLRFDPHFVIVSNPTAYHFEILKNLILRQVNFLCEKPLVVKLNEIDELENALFHYSKIGAVAFNMRFHPCITKLQEIMATETIGRVLSVRLFVGQYLPDWRPGCNYSKTYSAVRNLGGGVTLDLIHEIDLALHLFGEPSSEIQSISGKFSDLKIETEDITEILYLSNTKTVVSIHLDYVFQGYKREILIVGEDGNILIDLFSNSIRISAKSNKVIQEFNFPTFTRNDMYMSLLQAYLSDLNCKTYGSPSLQDGLRANKIATTILQKHGLI